MTVQEIVHRYRSRFIERYGATLTPAQWSALNAMQGCRQGQYGELAWACHGCERSTYSLAPVVTAVVISVRTTAPSNG